MFVFRIRQKNPPRYQRIPERRKSSGTGDGYVTTAASETGGVKFFCRGREKKPPKDEGPGRQKSSGAAEGHASAAAFGTSNIKFFLPTFSFKKK